MDATPSQPEPEHSQSQQQPQQSQQQQMNPYNGATPAATAGGSHNGMVSPFSYISGLLFALPLSHVLIAICDPPISI